MVVSPNTDANVIAKTKTLGMASYPGVFTPSECFAALDAGADALKVFPAVMMGLNGLRAIRAVLPPEVRLYMVGGVGPEDFAIWLKAGASGFGLGSALYKPGRNAAEVARLARLAVAAWDACEKP
ncbi:MAG: 2-dehydro-3-deoxy-6-phosphogalactonate aldolase, partial [Alphaproteobacteria bacterium]|nr:2-dehydro-3-deoxy-6-phosphogalactonate aldolase [Alphaproteobacteria bacterium]